MALRVVRLGGPRELARLALVLIGIALAGALLPAIRAARLAPANLIGSTGE